MGQPTSTVSPLNPVTQGPADLFAQILQDNDVLYRCTWIWFMLAGIAVSMRVFIRTKLVGKFGWDDLTSVVAMAVYTAFSSILFIIRHFAEWKVDSPYSDIKVPPGSDTWKQEMAELTYYGANLWQVQSLLYIVGIGFTRISVGLLYLRVIPPGTRPWARKSTLVVIYSTVVISTVVFFIDLLECRPIGAVRADPLTPGTTTCMDRHVLPIAIIIYSIQNLLADFAFAIIPIAMLWGMQMPWSRKIGPMIFMSMGLVASGTIIWRLDRILQPEFINLEKEKEKDYWFVEEHVLTLKVDLMLSWTMEMSICLMASSMATFKPLFTWLRELYESHVRCPCRIFLRRIFPSRRPPSITIPPLTPTPLGSPMSPNMPGDNAFTRRMAEYRHMQDYELGSRGTPSTETNDSKHWPSVTDEESPISPAFPATTFVCTNSDQALISLTPTSVRSGHDFETTLPTMYERDDVPSLPTIPSGQVLGLSHSQSQSTIQSIPMDYNELFLGMPATLTEARIRGSSTQGSHRSRR